MSGRIAIELKKTSVLLEVIGLHLSKRFHHCPHITKKGCWERSIWRSRCLEFGLTKDICFVQSTSLRVEDPSFQTSGVAVVVQQRLNQCNLWLRNMRNRKPIYIYTYVQSLMMRMVLVVLVPGSGSWVMIGGTNANGDVTGADGCKKCLKLPHLSSLSIIFHPHSPQHRLVKRPWATWHKGLHAWRYTIRFRCGTFRIPMIWEGENKTCFNQPNILPIIPPKKTSIDIIYTYIYIYINPYIYIYSSFQISPPLPEENLQPPSFPQIKGFWFGLLPPVTAGQFLTNTLEFEELLLQNCYRWWHVANPATSLGGKVSTG